VTAGEDQPQPLVRHDVLRILSERFVHAGRLQDHLVNRLLEFDQQRQLGAERLLAPQRVHSPALGRGGEPGGRVLWDAVAGPGDQRLGVRLLHALLAQVEIARDAHRRGQHQGPLATVRVGDRFFDQRRHAFSSRSRR
jgi:hypothetical protein